MMGYDYTILYKKCKEKLVVDALSRYLMEEAQLLTISTITSDFTSRIRGAYAEDAHLQ